MSHSIEKTALVISHLLVSGRATGSAPITGVEVVFDSSRRKRASVATDLRFPLEGQAEVTDDAPAGFLLACPLEGSVARAVAESEGPVQVRLHDQTGPIAEERLSIGSYEGSGMHEHADQIRLLCRGMSRSHAHFARVLASIADTEHASPDVWCELDTRLVASGCGIAVAGRAENLGAHRVVFLLDDFRIAVSSEQVFIGVDVARPLAGPTSHNFAFMESIGGQRHELRLAAVSEASVRWSDPMMIDEPCMPRQLLESVARMVTPRALLARLPAAAAAREIADRGRQVQPAASTTEYMRDGGRPRLSVVVHFQGDSFFLLDHIESQRRADDGTEWVFACDDHAILPKLADQLQTRRSRMLHATRLVALGERAGYAVTNNFGFRSTSADYVLLMGCNVYWRSFAPFQYALDLLRNDDSVGVVGFTLHFEDGTLQHSGVELQVTPEWNDMLVPRHTGKGLPGRELGPAMTAREVEGVAGAMMIRRSDFDGTVFDERYSGGRFEDQDLCLEMRARGKKIMLVECPGLFHLQRWSTGEDGVFDLVSIVNCIQFNEKWTAVTAMPR